MKPDSTRLRLQRQAMRGLLIDERTAERHWKVLIVGPDRQQVAVERTFRLTRLPGGIDRHRVIPVRDVDDFAEGRAVGADRAIAAATLDRGQVKGGENRVR